MADLREDAGGNPRAYRNHTGALWIAVFVLILLAGAATLLADSPVP